MKRFSAVTCAMLLLLSWSATGQEKPASKNKSTPAAPSVVAADRGKFRINSNGQQVGVEEFSVSANGAEWISRASVEIKAPDAGSAKVTGELRLAADGRPLGYQWASQGAKKTTGTVKFEGSTAEMELKVEGEPTFTQEFQFDSPQVVILDNNFYHHFGLLVRMFDWNAKGVQTFSVLIPQDLASGKLTVEWAGPRDLDGVKAEMLRVRSSDLEIELYVSGGRLVQVSVPISKAEIKRE